MTSFMGPMAPPPAAPPQPQAMDFQTDPTNRQRFRQFLNNRMQPPMMQPPMMQPPAHMPPILPEIDIFAPQGYADGGIVGFSNGGSTQPIEQRVMKNGQIGLFRGQTFLGFKQGSEEEKEPPLLSLAKFKEVLGLEDGGSVPSTLPRSKKDAIAQKVAEMMAIDAERVRAAQQNAEYNRLLRDQDAIDRQVALDRLRADQAESRQDMTLDSILSDIDYETRGLLKRADGGSVPPRRTEIGGNDHMLSYITPDEADILMALGGSGEAGPMGIPSFNPNEDRANEEAGGFGEDPGFDGGGGGSAQTENVSLNDDNRSDYRGYTEEDEQQQTVDMGNYENDFGGDSPDGYSVQDILNDNAEKAAIERAIATTNAINTANQQNFNNLPQRLAETQLDPMGTLAKPDINEILDFDAGPVIGDIESVGTGIASVNTGASKGTSPTSSLLGGNNLLGDTDTYRDAIESRKAMDTINARSLENQRMQNNQLGVNEIQDFSTGSIDFDDELDVTAPEVLGMTDQDTEEASDYVGGAKVGSRFGTATGPGRLSTVTAEEMENLRTGNAVQRQMYRQLAGIKSAGPVLSSFDPNNVKDPNILDSIFGLTNKPSSAVEVFRAPITEQKGFKSVNTGTFKDGIAGVTGEGNMPGVMGGIMQMFGIDPIVYTGDNRFDPNRPPEDFGGGDGPERPVATVDPCPPGFSLVNGTCTPVSDSGSGDAVAPADPANPYISSPVIVPSPRQPMPFLGQMPSGYGTPVTGGVNPQVMSEMQKYAQLLSRPQPQYPVGLANGGPVSSNLDMAADNFLKALMPAA